MARSTNGVHKATEESPREELALLARPGYLLHKASQLIDEGAEQALTQVGLKAREFFVLSAVAGGPDLSQQDLSRLLGLDPTTVVAVIDELEHRTYVERRRNPTDRRRYILILTEAGRAALAEADRVATQVEAEFLGELSATERTALRDMLRRVLAGRWPAFVDAR